MRNWIGVVALLLPVTAQGAPSRAVFARAAKSFVAITVEFEPDGAPAKPGDTVPRHVGSGTVVEVDGMGSTILTCAHLVQAPPGYHLDSIAVQAEDDEEVDAVLQFDGFGGMGDVMGLLLGVDDLATLRTSRPVGRRMIVAKNPPERFSRLYVFGQPVGYGLHVAEGILDARDGVMLGHSYYRITAPLIPGMSGGAVTDTQGRLVCVVSNVYAMPDPNGNHGRVLAPGFGLCISLPQVRAFLSTE